MKRINIWIIFLSFVSLQLLSACRYASGPQFEPYVQRGGTSKSILYIYRPQAAFFEASDKFPAYLYVDGKRIVRMKIGGYTQLLVEPGEHEVKIWAVSFFLVPTFRLGAVGFKAEGGKEYYFAFQSNVAGISPGGLAASVALGGSNADLLVDPLITNTDFNMVTKEDALPELTKTRFMQPAWW